MGLRTTAVLAAVAAALAAFILLVDRRTVSTDEARAGGHRVFPDLSREAITRLKVDRTGGGWVVERAGGGAWRLLAGGAADSAAVDALLSLLETAEVERVVEAAGGPTGDGAGAVEIEARTAAGQAFVLRLGAPDPTRRGCYARRGGDARLLVVEGRLRELADKGPAELRDRHVFQLAPGELRRLAFRTAAGRGQMFARDGAWFTEATGGVRLSAERVREAVRALSDLRVRFVAAPAALPEPASLALEAEAPALVKLDVRSAAGPCAAGEVVASRSAPGTSDWLCLASDATGRLERALQTAAARDPHLVAARADEIAGITLTASDRRLELRRDGGGWKIAAPAVHYAADSDAVGKWLDELAAFRLEEQSAPAGATDRTLVLATGAGRETIGFGAARDGLVRVERAGESAAGATHAEVLALLEPEPLRFRARAVLDFARYDARRLHIESPLGVEEAVKGAGEDWRLERPVAVDADPETMDKVLGALSALKAERFEPKAPAGKPERTLAVTIAPAAGASGNATHTLRLFPSCLATLAPGDGATFRLPAATCADLRQPLATRRLLALDDTRLLGVTLREGTRARTFERRGPDWYAPGGAKAAGTQVTDLLAALRDLRARDVAAYGPPSPAARWPIELAVRADGAPDQHLRIGPLAPDRSRSARLDGRDVAYTLAPEHERLLRLFR